MTEHNTFEFSDKAYEILHARAQQMLAMEEKDREAKRVQEKEEMRKEAEKTENMEKKPDRERKE